VDGGAKNTFKYDSIVTDHIIEDYYYIKSDTGWVIDEDNAPRKHVITRDDKGNITQQVVLDWVDGAWKEDTRVEITYDENSVAQTFRDTYLYEDEDTAFWSENAYLKNMKWHKPHGQITETGYSMFIGGDNLLESADIYSGDKKEGTLTITWEDNGSYVCTEMYDSYTPIKKAVYKETVADEGRSVTYEIYQYLDYDQDGTITENDLVYSSKYIYKLDKNGFDTYVESWGDGKLEFAYKTDYTYTDSSKTDYSESIQYSKDSDDGEWVPYIKCVRYDFKTIDTAVNAIKEDDTNAPTAVYNAAGVRMQGSLDTLPKGLYIVKKGAKTTKVLRR